MTNPSQDRSAKLWRAAAGILAVVAVGIALLRLAALAVGGLPEGATSIGYILRIVFPLGIGIAFAFIAFSRRLWHPANDRSDNGDS